MPSKKDPETYAKKRPDQKPKEYSKELTKYVNHTLTDLEKPVYKLFFDSIKEKHHIVDPTELMMLDTAITDFIRIKRLQVLLNDRGDTYQLVLRTGDRIEKVHEAAYLLNAVEAQFRNTMREMGLTRKEYIKRADKKTQSTDFANLLSDKDVIEVEPENDVPTD